MWSLFCIVFAFLLGCGTCTCSGLLKEAKREEGGEGGGGEGGEGSVRLKRMRKK